MTHRLWLALAAAGLAAPPALGAGTRLARAEGTGVTLRISVTNVRVAKGRVNVALCREAEFLKDCAIVAEAPAVAGTTVITLHDVPPGDYAVQGTLDENGNGRVDRGLFGIPKEGVGFSNDAPIRLAPPKWKDACFRLDGDMAISFKLRYF